MYVTKPTLRKFRFIQILRIKCVGVPRWHNIHSRDSLHGLIWLLTYDMHKILYPLASPLGGPTVYMKGDINLNTYPFARRNVFLSS